MQRIKSSLSAKVFLWVLCALTLCSFLIYTFVMIIIPRRYTVLTNTYMEQKITELAETLEGSDYASAGQEIYLFCVENHVTAMLNSGEQTVMFGGNTNVQESENTSSVSLVLQFSDLSEGSILTVLLSSSAAGEITDTFLKTLPLAAALILAVSSLSAWFCSRIITKPVLQISSVSKRMAQLDMTWHCGTGRTDELGTLADSLNTLSQRLTRTMSELENANARLRADIAASRTLEKQRRDFFAAASHELKTPITVLKGQLESMTLGIGDYRNHEKYLPQTLTAVEEIEQLIQELLTITKMESGIPESSFTSEYLAPVLRSCMAELEPLAAEKQISIGAAQLNEAVSVAVNKQLFRKAVSNILSNAVRYSPEGQRITITLTDSALAVENTGVTIAEEDLPSLFTPFYRSDKSRSRKSGGSGLGLYIVKTILDLHGLGCKIENHGNAVRFTVLLNQN